MLKVSAGNDHRSRLILCRRNPRETRTARVSPLQQIKSVLSF